MSRSIIYMFLALLIGFSGSRSRACSLKHYDYCETALGKKCGLETKRLANDNQNEVPYLKRKYKTKGIQVIIPTLPFLNFQHVVYHNDYVPHLSVWDKKTSEIRANCKRGPPLA